MNTIRNVLYALAMIATFLMMGISDIASAKTISELSFRVYLDGREIGTHRVELRRSGQQEEVSIEADFDVNVLFVNVYSYRHRNSETWQGECLSEINARTDANGDEFFVVSKGREQGLNLRTHEGEKVLEGCVRSFAYWDPELLRAERLLNTQTGEYVPVSIEEVGIEPVLVNGMTIMAKRYRLQADGDVIELWYANGNRWVALESKTEKGMTIRYERVQEPLNVSASI